MSEFAHFTTAALIGALMRDDIDDFDAEQDVKAELEQRGCTLDYSTGALVVIDPRNPDINLTEPA